MVDLGLCGLNKKMVPDCYPIPLIDEMIDTMGYIHYSIAPVIFIIVPFTLGSLP